MEDLLTEVKQYLFISGTKFDTVLQNLIDAVVDDLSRASLTDTTNKLFRLAVCVGVRANFGELTPQQRQSIGEKYEQIKIRLALTTDFSTNSENTAERSDVNAS
jgi:hypothetical protein